MVEFNGFTMVHSKIVFEYLNPRPEIILIEDIAHALSHLCRFTGHTNKFYSVAEHSVLVSQYCSPGNRLWGLLHDAAEAYINDLASPLKRIIGGDYKKIENNILLVICEKYGLPPRMPDEVKWIDKNLTVDELRIFIDPDYEEEGHKSLITNINPWSPKIAKREFLDAFANYYKGETHG